MALPQLCKPICLHVGSSFEKNSLETWNHNLLEWV